MSIDVKEVLESLGYKLSDRGPYWQTNAMFRDGDNKTALQIYKDTGVWKDYVQDTPYAKFESLVKKTLGTNNKSILKKYLKDSDLNDLKERRATDDKIKMEEIFDIEVLEKLLPHYKFYNERGITDDTLKFFRGGFATYGQMNKRFVFPIFNQYHQIHGFAGRDMISRDNRPKWKHIGRKSNWIYPAYLKDRDGTQIADIISETGKVILVESIGDLLALYEQGIKNVLVTFGLDVSPSLICFLSGASVNKIVLAFNNDSAKEENRGLNACIKNYLKLLGHFDAGMVQICLPTANDFGDMDDDDFAVWKKKHRDLDGQAQQAQVRKTAQLLFKKGKLSKNIMNNIKYINE
jgi:hypothetical protein